jgi:carbon-monoxide dehydrogenase large subunit
MKFGVGQPVKRFEDATLVTGMGSYTDDISLPGMLHACFVRSPHAHARIRGIDTAAARAMPSVHAVLTGEDVAADKLGDLPCVAPLNNRDGTPRKDTPRPVLAIGKVRHVGQPVALVVADTLAQAKDAAETIVVDYEELPAVVDTRGALASDAQLFDHIPHNVVFDWDNDMCDFAATEDAFKRAAHVTTLEIVNNRVVANSMEPRNAIGDYDTAKDRYVLYTGTQGSHFVRDPLAEIVLKVPKERVRVVTPTNVGGGFGMKAFVYPEQVLVTWAAGKLKRPVKWQSDRSEGFVSDNQGRDQVTRAELAMDKDGRFLGLRVNIVANVGAYLSPMGAFIPTRSSDLVAGLYTTPAISVNVKGVCTNTVPVCAYRGAGRPEASYMIERLVDAAARDMKMSPDAIRRINFVPPTAMPYTAATKITFDTGEFERVMDLCMQKSDWAGFSKRRAESEKHGRLRGIGMATYTERCGGGFAETASIEFKGDRVDLVMGNQEYGTGLYTAYKQLVHDRLGIDPGKIDIVMGDTDRSPRGLTGGSRALPVAGSALHEASLKIIEKGRQIAAHMLEASAQDVEFREGAFRIVGTDRRVGLFEVAAVANDKAKLPPGIEPGLDVTHVQTPSANTFPNGCHTAEVEIDPDNGVVSIVRYTIVDDFGAVINPMLLEGQVHGGVVQGLGQALFEHTVYDQDSGQLLSGSFSDYTMPRADHLPFFSFSTHNVPCKANPLGVKGAGEAGAIGSPSAVINAVVDALHHKAGIRHIDMPATPFRVWSALQAAAA